MSTLFEKLRAMREAKGITLEDVASATRIQTRILRALEMGDVSAFPEVYVRAFLRAYAKKVGVNVAEVLEEYEAHCRRLSSTKLETAGVVQQAGRIESFAGFTRAWSALSRRSQNAMTLLIGGVLIILLVVSISTFDDGKRADEVPQLPVTAQRQVVTPADTGQSSLIAGPVERVAEQPLILRAMTFDSVWIRVVVDGKLIREYQAPPRWSMQWKAREQFLISLDNAGAVTFALNNVSLGMIGEEGKPVVNYLIRRPGASPR